MKRGILGFAVAVMVFGLSAISSFAATGTVTAETAKIRESASTDSTVVGSTKKGSKIDIVGAEKDSSGTTWYKVPVSGGSYGYVRSDLVETSDNISVTETTTTTTATTTTQAEKPAATVPTAIGEQAATVTCDSNVKVRAGASTKHDVVTSLPNGTAITLIGEASDAAGNKWYQLQCEYNGKNIEGYIRSDLITIGAPSTETEEGEAGTQDGQEGTETEGMDAENPEGEAPEETYEEPVAEHRDYEVVYTPDAENPDTGKYYLYNNLEGTMADVEALFQTVTDANTKLADLEASASQKNIVIIILAVVIVLLFGGITFLILRLKNAYDYDYEDEEEEEEVYEEPVVRRRRREPDGEVRTEREVRPEREMRQERAERGQNAERPERRERVREQGTERNEERSRVRAEQQERRSVNAQDSGARRAPRKAQNFLTDDDEFEFEFLNMDDKDL